MSWASSSLVSKNQVSRDQSKISTGIVTDLVHFYTLGQGQAALQCHTAISVTVGPFAMPSWRLDRSRRDAAHPLDRRNVNRLDIAARATHFRWPMSIRRSVSYVAGRAFPRSPARSRTPGSGVAFISVPLTRTRRSWVVRSLRLL